MDKKVRAITCSSEGYYEFGNRLKVYLIATDLRGLHRVPEEFIIKGEI